MSSTRFKHPFRNFAETSLSARIGIPLLCLQVVANTLAADVSEIEPGPENAGMRLRFLVVPERKGTNEIYRVRLDLINTTDKPIELIADWDESRDGTFQEFLEADLSITTNPPLMPPMGQMMVNPRKRPEPAYTLGAHETVTAQWTTTGRRLKSTSLYSFAVHNPGFPTDGLYSVHGSLSLLVAGIGGEKQPTVANGIDAIQRLREKRIAAGLNGNFDVGFSVLEIPQGNVQLRSNEQLVPVCGSHAMPKHALARLISADTNQWTTTIDLGSAHKIEVGDHFQILTRGMGTVWHLSITNVDRLFAQGTLKPPAKRYEGDSSVLIPGTLAELILPNDPRRNR